MNISSEFQKGFDMKKCEGCGNGKPKYKINGIKLCLICVRVEISQSIAHYSELAYAHKARAEKLRKKVEKFEKLKNSLPQCHPMAGCGG